MKSISISLLMAVIFSAGVASAYPHYRGYSGSPGRQACSVSCHHRHNFSPSMTVTGFPESYLPDQQYTIAFGHESGSSISQFNCSARIGTGSSNAGTMSAGVNTATYNVSNETNGVHATAEGINSGTFIWTAPPAGTGSVRLYWAGLQGNLSGGADTQIVLISNEDLTGVNDDPGIPTDMSLAQIYPNPFNSETIIRFHLADIENARIMISDILGQAVYEQCLPNVQQGDISIVWNGKNNDGLDLPSGIYFYQLQIPGATLIRRMILLR